MRILVTGATGFIGACLARRMVHDGHEVHIFSREHSYTWRIADLMTDIRDHRADLRDASAIDAAVLRIKPEAIFHLATYGGFASQQDGVEIFHANCIGTMNLVKACENIDFCCFVNTGSSSEYGIKERPMREDDLLEPVGDYGVTKAAATLFCRSEAVLKGLPLVTFRVFSPYGPWDDPKRMIPYVISSILLNKPPALAKPDSVRDYIYIDDVVDAYAGILKTQVQPGEIYNIGSGRQSTIGEVVRLICDILPGVDPQWGTAQLQRPEPKTWVADVAKITSATDWRPETRLADGLAKTIDWMRDNVGHYN